MRQTFDLSTLTWTLTGWHPWFWKPHCSMETGASLLPAVGPILVSIPSSVQQALRDAALLPDWQHGLNSLNCEWVEHRHWVYETDLPDDWVASTDHVYLDCAGLDFQGCLLVNGIEIGTFRNTFLPHHFDLTPFLLPRSNHLTIVFTENPPALGQVGFTSQFRDWKARFYYIWDFTPRIVQTGIWDTITLTATTGDAIERLALYTEYDYVTQRGTVIVDGACQHTGATAVEIAVFDAGHEIACQTFPVSSAWHHQVGDIPVKPWNPNASGEQQQYTVEIRLLASNHQVVDTERRRVGFRSIDWQPCTNAPRDAEPWICCINGAPTFLKGINWVPLRPTFADLTETDYRERLTLYRDAGVNLLRIWSGAVLEKEVFYNLCDELGLLVWQEFPQCSSWLENWPSEDPARIAEIHEIAISYITRRQHHPSLIMWCGGNELQGAVDGGKVGVGKPIDRGHPMMVELADVVQRYDPTRRFTPTSPTGPTFYAVDSAYGQDVHHEVHGPWDHSGPMESWQAYWDADDALFRSEVGMPGSCSEALLERISDGPILPADNSNPLWRHSGSTWIQWTTYLTEGGDPDDLQVYVTWSQQRQAEALAYAAQACQRRFPAIGGIIFWMGHDAFPCPVGLSLIDAFGNPKPAFWAIARIFRQQPNCVAPPVATKSEGV